MTEKELGEILAKIINTNIKKELVFYSNGKGEITGAEIISKIKKERKKLLKSK